jgi:hypothetical protein
MSRTEMKNELISSTFYLVCKYMHSGKCFLID